MYSMSRLGVRPHSGFGQTQVHYGWPISNDQLLFAALQKATNLSNVGHEFSLSPTFHYEENIGNPKQQKLTLCGYRSSIQAMINIPVASSSQLCAACAGLQVVLCVLLYAVPGQHKVAWTPKSCHSSQ